MDDGGKSCAAQREALLRRLAEAQRMELAARFSAAMAHDFGNLFSSVGLLAHLARKETAGAGAGAASLARIEQAVVQGRALLGRVLDYASADDEARATDVGALTRDLASALQSMLGKEIAVTARVEEGVGAALCEKGKVRLALYNLARNAEEAMAMGGALCFAVSSAAASGAAAPGRCVAIRVRDSGPGLGGEALRRAFEPFFTTKGDAHAGLGLAISRMIARDAGGDIVAENAQGGGAAFTLLLPEVSSPAEE